jgi:hypothetical protein
MPFGAPSETVPAFFFALAVRKLAARDFDSANEAPNSTARAFCSAHGFIHSANRVPSSAIRAFCSVIRVRNKAERAFAGDSLVFNNAARAICSERLERNKDAQVSGEAVEGFSMASQRPHLAESATGLDDQ